MHCESRPGCWEWKRSVRCLADNPCGSQTRRRKIPNGKDKAGLQYRGYRFRLFPAESPDQKNLPAESGLKKGSSRFPCFLLRSSAPRNRSRPDAAFPARKLYSPARCFSGHPGNNNPASRRRKRPTCAGQEKKRARNRKIHTAVHRMQLPDSHPAREADALLLHRETAGGQWYPPAQGRRPK